MLGINEDILPPQLLDDLLAADQLAVSTGQQDQQLHGDSFQLDHGAVASQLVGTQVELDVFEFQQCPRDWIHG